MAVFPFAAANVSAVSAGPPLPPPVSALSAAPRSSSRPATSIWPRAAAHIKGVTPFKSRWFGSAPSSSIRSARAASPERTTSARRGRWKSAAIASAKKAMATADMSSSLRRIWCESPRL